MTTTMQALPSVCFFPPPTPQCRGQKHLWVRLHHQLQEALGSLPCHPREVAAAVGFRWVPAGGSPAWLRALSTQRSPLGGCSSGQPALPEPAAQCHPRNAYLQLFFQLETETNDNKTVLNPQYLWGSSPQDPGAWRGDAPCLGDREGGGCCRADRGRAGTPIQAPGSPL